MASKNEIPQSAVLAYSFEGGTPKVLMVTSRGRGRWVLPKGGIEEGQSAQEAAVAEAYEEAGIRGRVADSKIGTYTYSKVDQPEKCAYHVRVYPMTVSHMSDDWPEKDQRDRTWMDFPSAANAVEEPELRHLLNEFGTMLTTLVSHKA
ncbi:MAG: NUDIX hydrolase [Rhodospirillales bacterium]|nr:NUDIX hydrolase [Rhodospirillales bacterium]MBO6785956.1 NUDIX hydrolase [Rhodospirillales bacterium]